MRISSNQIHQVAVNAMLDQESKLSHVQRQVASGKRIFSTSDDPVAAARIIDLQQSVDNFDQYQSSINSGKARLEIQEGVLANAINVLQRVRELTIQANNAIQTNDTRASIAQEIEQLNSELKGLANAVDGNSDYLFAGSKVKFQPFTDTTSGQFQYNGDDGQRMLQIGENRQISVADSGTEVFRTIKNGNGDFTITPNSNNLGTSIANPGSSTSDYKPGTYLLQFEQKDKFSDITYRVTDVAGNVIVAPGTKYNEEEIFTFGGVQTSFIGFPENGDSYLFKPSINKDVFSTLRDLSISLDTPRNTPKAKSLLGNSVNQSLVSIDEAIDKILTIRANTGSRLRALDNQQEINSSHLLHLKEIQSDIKDLDYTEAVTRLNLRLTGLEASQIAYSKVQNLSMFDYI
ncbi:MAG: flagellar hook-associated protein FlgL [Gammaproteobacteria bacterium]